MNKSDQASSWRFFKEVFNVVMVIVKPTSMGLNRLYVNRDELVKELIELIKLIKKFSKEEPETE